MGFIYNKSKTGQENTMYHNLGQSGWKLASIGNGCCESSGSNRLQLLYQFVLILGMQPAHQHLAPNPK